jgi:poly-gamma-glutamate synthesis protein (capsule biosynthesis protein)
VPHHLLARDLIAKTFVTVSRGSYQRVVVMSPDHNNLGRTDISVADADFATVFGVIETDRALVRRLTELESVTASRFFYREHGIQAILPFVKYYFPGARVLAVTFKERTGKKDLDTFIDVLETVLDRETLILQSTDFSHYLPAEVANIKDEETIAVIRSGDPQKVFSLRQPANLDSRAAQYVEMRLQKDLFGASPQITGHKNSQEYSREKLAKTTSYITQIYVPRASTPSSYAERFSDVFVSSRRKPGPGGKSFHDSVARQ